MDTIPSSIYTQVMSLQLSSSNPNRVSFHPNQPTTYFKTVLATSEPELKFNNIEYYYHETDVDDIANKMDLNTLHVSLCRPNRGPRYVFPFKAMKIGPNDVRPAYMPNISDCEAYLHKGAVVFMRWFCNLQCHTSPEYIPKELVPVFDMKIIINPKELPVFAMPVQPRDIFFGANKHGVHVLEIKANLSVATLLVESHISVASKSRYYKVNVSSEIADTYCNMKKFPRGAVVVVWNARCVHRPSFEENFNRLRRSFKPMIIMMTEARTAENWIERAKDTMGGLYRVESFGADCDLGGVLLAWDNRVEPFFTHRQATLYGNILSLTVLPSYRLHPQPPRVLPDGGD